VNSRTVARHVFGYLVGIFVFGLAIPYGLFNLAMNHPINLPIGYAARQALALILATIGIFFVLWSNAALLIQGKGGPTDAFNVAISPRTKRLVIRGPYRYTRNPMVFGALSIYFALTVYWDSLQAVLALITFCVIVRFYLRATEEKRLLKDFGQEFEHYRKTTSMIVPWPRRRAKDS